MRRRLTVAFLAMLAPLPVVAILGVVLPEAARLPAQGVALALGAAAGVALANRTTASIVGPLTALERAARRAAEHDYAGRVPVRGDDELGRTAAAFNAMLDHLGQSRRELVHRAHHDPLTGLPNRAAFADRTRSALDRARTQPVRTQELAVLLIDLDGFKAVNDTLGHEAGDTLLVEVAERLRGQLRPDDTIARLGGDEFAVLLAQVRSAADARRVADRLIAALAEPIVLGGEAATVGASIGIAVRSDRREDADTLLRHADAAMYAAKGAGKNRHRLFEPGLLAEAEERDRIEDELGGALERGELLVAYRPVVALPDRGLAAVEAQLRWAHPARGAVEAEELALLAEQTGLAVQLGRFALEEACRQAADLAALRPGDEPLAVHVPLSAAQFQDSNVVADVQGALRRAGLPSRQLVLELSEPLLVAEGEAAADALADLDALGVRLALTGFGTGGAGLSHLRAAPLSLLKLDPRLLITGSDGRLVRAVAGLGQALGLTVVADGVDRADQAAHLAGLGCELSQGRLFGAPLSHTALAARLAQESGIRASAS